VPDLIVPLGGRSLAPRLADLIRETRILIGWTQRDLARRAGVSQAAICRIETVQAGVIDVLVIERVLGALGMRAELQVDGRHLADRRRQRDAVHARVDGFLAHRFGTDGWLTATEVEVGEGAPRGWIDLLAFRPIDRALVVDETRTDLPDIGGLQRSVAFYERAAPAAARLLGWNPTRVVVLVTVLDTAVVARRLAENRDLVSRAFPSPVARFSAWVADPSSPAPFGWTLASCDPATRSAAWLRPTTLGTRRRPPAYNDYADAAARLRVRR
jgi:transcriptional regulator with XRE-family HTH domain